MHSPILRHMDPLLSHSGTTGAREGTQQAMRSRDCAKRRLPESWRANYLRALNTTTGSLANPTAQLRIELLAGT